MRDKAGRARELGERLRMARKDPYSIVWMIQQLALQIERKARVNRDLLDAEEDLSAEMHQRRSQLLRGYRDAILQLLSDVDELQEMLDSGKVPEFKEVISWPR